MSEAETKMLLPIDRLMASLAPIIMKPILEPPLTIAKREQLAAEAQAVLRGHHTQAEAHLCRAVELLCTHHPNEWPALHCVEAAHALVRWLRSEKRQHEDEMDARSWQAKEAHR